MEFIFWDPVNSEPEDESNKGVETEKAPRDEY
jgi:hypothetical protein